MTGRVRAACLTHHTPLIKPTPRPLLTLHAASGDYLHAASGDYLHATSGDHLYAASGDPGGSSSNSNGGPGMRYCSPNQRPRSTSAQRGEQNGRFANDGARPQIGQRAGALTVGALAMRSLNTPAVTRQ